MPASIEKVSSGGSTTTTTTTPKQKEVSNTVATETVNLTDPSSKDFFVDDFTEYYVRKKGYMVGDNTGFNPNGDMTRAQMVQILYAMEGKPSGAKANFSDVKSGAWYSDAVAWAQSNGIVAGHTDGTFRPDDKITNEQMAAIMKKYAEFKGKDTSITNDEVWAIDKLDRSKYSKDALTWANQQHMFNVTSILDLKPKEAATRGDMAFFLRRFDHHYNGQEYLNVLNEYNDLKTKKYSVLGKECINSIDDNFSAFDDLFNENQYGGAQGDPSKIFDLNKYKTEKDIYNDNSINGQKAQILYETTKKYYPNATIEDVKRLTVAYNSSGCGYMATADAFALKISSLSNGEEVFNKTFGYDLYSKEGNQKNCNIECIAFEEYLYINKEYEISDLVSEIHASFPDSEKMQEFYASKNIMMDSKQAYLSNSSDEKRQQMLTQVGEYAQKHPDAIYTVTGYNFNMDSLNYAKSKDIDLNDAALFSASIQGGKVKNVTAHAVFLTGINDDNLIVSSWGNKYAIPIKESFANQPFSDEKGYYIPDFMIHCMDFDFNKVGGKK